MKSWTISYVDENGRIMNSAFKVDKDGAIDQVNALYRGYGITKIYLDSGYGKFKVNPPLAKGALDGNPERG